MKVKVVLIVLILCIIIIIFSSIYYIYLAYIEYKEVEEAFEEVGEAQKERVLESIKKSQNSEFELLEVRCINGTISFKVKNIGQNPATFGLNIYETTDSPEVVKCNSCGGHASEIPPNEEGEASCWYCGSGYHNFEIRFANTINVTVYCE